jgi:predicted transcriptional regulator
MAKKKKQPKGRARERGDSITFTFEMSPALNEAVGECAEKDMRTKRAVIVLALQDYLQRQGLWPPAAEGGKR